MGVLDRVPDEHRPRLRRLVGDSRTTFASLTRGSAVTKAQRVVWLRPETAHIEQVVLPGPRADQLLVRIDASVISPGTERAFLMGLPNTSQKFPSGAGYAAAGTVTRVGKAVRDWGVGDRAAGIAPHASHALVTPGQVIKVPDGVSTEVAAFTQLGAIALHSVRRGGIRPGESVAVMGLGLIGQLTLQLARWAGASPLIGLARRSSFFDAARSSGSDVLIALDEEQEAVEDIQADVVIDVTGSPEALPVAIRAARCGGRVVVAGSPRGVTRGIDFESDVRRRGIQLIGAHVGGVARLESSPTRWTRRDESELFLNLVADGLVVTDHLISFKADPNNANEVYETLIASGNPILGALFDWADAKEQVT